MAMSLILRSLRVPKMLSRNVLVERRATVENFASVVHVTCSTPLLRVRRMRKKRAKDEVVNVSAVLLASSRLAEMARALVLSPAPLHQSGTDGEAHAREE
jgi:hypothetical protein